MHTLFTLSLILHGIPINGVSEVKLFWLFFEVQLALFRMKIRDFSRKDMSVRCAGAFGTQ